MAQKTVRLMLKHIELYYDGDEFVEEGQTGRLPYNRKYQADK